MAEASNVAIDFDGDAVVDDAWLMGGEDHGLLATFPPEVTLPEGFHPVGVVRDYEPSGDDVGTGDVSTGGSPTPRVTVSGVAPDIERGGWDPYRDSVKTRVSP
jgi:thiamine-monophosphate kinase